MHKLFLNIKKFILTSRYDKPHGILLLYYPCLWGLSLSDKNILEVFHLCIIFFLGACGMRSVGCIWNDINDKKFDIFVKRTKKRLIATGEVSKIEALIYAFINLCIGIIPLFFINKFSIILCFAILPLIASYPFMKRITWWPQLWLGINFNWGVLIGYYSLTEPHVSLNIILFYLGCIFWTTAYDTIYGFQDIEDDLKLGVKSTSIKFRSSYKAFLIINYSICFLCWSTSIYFYNMNFILLLTLSVLFLIIIRSVTRTNIEKPESCEKSFKKNSYFGLSVSTLLALNNILFI